MCSNNTFTGIIVNTISTKWLQYILLGLCEWRLSSRWVKNQEQLDVVHWSVLTAKLLSHTVPRLHICMSERVHLYCVWCVLDSRLQEQRHSGPPDWLPEPVHQTRAGPGSQQTLRSAPDAPQWLGPNRTHRPSPGRPCPAHTRTGMDQGKEGRTGKRK